MSVDRAVQTAIRARLIATVGVTSLVPALSILDRNARPAPDPSIILGEGQTIDDGRLDRKVQRIFATLHIWKKEPGLGGAKDIGAAIREAIRASRLTIEGYHCGDCYVSDARYMRDPDGETAHGVVTIETVVREP